LITRWNGGFVDIISYDEIADVNIFFGELVSFFQFTSYKKQKKMMEKKQNIRRQAAEQI
jgi:hypothetical protein